MKRNIYAGCGVLPEGVEPVGQVSLPVTDEHGFYEIRFESIGGLGAHLAGQMLAEAGVLRMGLNGAHFSSYGSEKKGSPIKSYVRFCAPRQEVRSASPVLQPHLVAVFHEGLLRTENVAGGLRPGGVIVVNSKRSPGEIRARLGVEGATVATVDALGIAVEERTRVNTALLGAVTRLSGFLDPEAVKETIRHTFQRKYPQLVEANLRTFDRGAAEVRLDVGVARDGAAPAFSLPEPLYGYRNAPIGGTIVNPGNSVLKDLSGSRQGFLPAFQREKCVDCAMCEIACPDFCFVWQDNPNPQARNRRMLAGIDYQYCKGCLKCVEVCPTGALVKMREAEGFAEEERVARFPGLLSEAGRAGDGAPPGAAASRAGLAEVPRAARA